jgi:hypothetical protein
VVARLVEIAGKLAEAESGLADVLETFAMLESSRGG